MPACPSTLAKGITVLAHAGEAGNHALGADAGELVHRALAAEEGEVTDAHMAAEHGIVLAKMTPLPTVQSWPSMGARHHHHAIADARDAAAHRARAGGGVLAEHAIRADDELWSARPCNAPTGARSRARRRGS